MDTEQIANLSYGDIFHTQCGIQLAFSMTQDINTFQDIPKTLRLRIKLTSEA